MPIEHCPLCGSNLTKTRKIVNELTEEPMQRFGYGIACPKGEAGLCDYGYWERPLTKEEAAKEWD